MRVTNRDCFMMIHQLKAAYKAGSIDSKTYEMLVKPAKVIVSMDLPKDPLRKSMKDSFENLKRFYRTIKKENEIINFCIISNDLCHYDDIREVRYDIEEELSLISPWRFLPEDVELSIHKIDIGWSVIYRVKIA